MVLLTRAAAIPISHWVQPRNVCADIEQAMKYLIDFVENNAPLIVFFNVLLTRGGLPLPVVPTLITAAALAGRSPAQISEIILAGLAATLAADLALYSLGHRYGWRFLGLLCQVSVSPDFCVRRTTNLYARVGSRSLLVAKFIPGMSLIAVAMAGKPPDPELHYPVVPLRQELKHGEQQRGQWE